MKDEAGSNAIDALRGRLTLLDESPTYPEWEVLADVFSCIIVNHDELISLLLYHQREPTIILSLMDQDPTNDKKRQYNRELLRLLINYVGSAKVLVDQSRVFMKRYEEVDDDLVSQYNRRILSLSNQTPVIFIQDLRNYLVHYRAPFFASRLSFGGESTGGSFNIRLSSSRLLEWSKWRPLSRSFLKQNEYVTIGEMVQGYTESVSDVYNWLLSLGIATVTGVAQLKLEVRMQLEYLEREMST